MNSKITDAIIFDPHKAAIPEVAVTTLITGQSTFYFDTVNTLKNGFIFT